MNQDTTPSTSPELIDELLEAIQCESLLKTNSSQLDLSITPAPL